MMSKLILIFFFLGMAFAQSQVKKYSFAEAEKLCQNDPKPYFIFIKSDWCKYCKMMENATFKNNNIINILNNDFYFIESNAEYKNVIEFNQKQFRFIPNGIDSGAHELALTLANVDGTIAYPTITIMDSNYSILYQKQSYIDIKSMNLILQKIKDQQ